MIRRLNHAVLWVRDAQRSAEFYTTVLGFEAVATMGSQAVFLRADGSTNDHDLGLFTVGDRPQPAAHSPGLYHLAWQVNTIEDLAVLRTKLANAGALVGESDHGVSKSLYAHDPDGIEFEIMWAVPRENWPTATPGTERLDLDAELARWAAVDTADQY
jgi:catechol-2,3-dioxygenase